MLDTTKTVMHKLQYWKTIMHKLQYWHGIPIRKKLSKVSWTQSAFTTSLAVLVNIFKGRLKPFGGDVQQSAKGNGNCNDKNTQMWAFPNKQCPGMIMNAGHKSVKLVKPCIYSRRAEWPKMKPHYYIEERTTGNSWRTRRRAISRTDLIIFSQLYQTHKHFGRKLENTNVSLVKAALTE